MSQAVYALFLQTLYTGAKLATGFGKGGEASPMTKSIDSSDNFLLGYMFVGQF